MAVVIERPDPGLCAPVQLTVLNLSDRFSTIRISDSLSLSSYLDVPPARSVFLIDSLGPGLSVPVQLSVLDLDISSPRLKTDI